MIFRYLDNIHFVNEAVLECFQYKGYQGICTPLLSRYIREYQTTSNELRAICENIESHHYRLSGMVLPECFLVVKIACQVYINANYSKALYRIVKPVINDDKVYKYFDRYSVKNYSKIPIDDNWTIEYIISMFRDFKKYLKMHHPLITKHINNLQKFENY